MAESLFSQLCVDDIIRFAHLDSLIVLDHDLIESISKSPDLPHHGMVVLIDTVSDLSSFIGAFLKLIELLSFRGSLGLHIIELPSLNGQIFLNILPSLSRGCLLISLYLLLELAL